MKIPVKKLHPDARLPHRAHPTDAGADIYVHRKTREVIGEITIVTYYSGIALAIPNGSWMDLRARSSVYKTRQWLCNGVGTIDSEYRGEIIGKFYHHLGSNEAGNTGEAEEYAIGDKFAQLVLLPGTAPEAIRFVETAELPDTDRGDGGFGSSGR